MVVVAPFPHAVCALDVVGYSTIPVSTGAEIGLWRQKNGCRCSWLAFLAWAHVCLSPESCQSRLCRRSRPMDKRSPS